MYACVKRIWIVNPKWIETSFAIGQWEDEAVTGGIYPSKNILQEKYVYDKQ